MNQDHFCPEQMYNYVDSSEEQCNQYDTYLDQQLVISDIQYQDSSSSSNQRKKKQSNRHHTSKSPKLHQNISKCKSNKLLQAKLNQHLLKDNNIGQIQRIVRQNQQKIIKQAPLLLPDTDKQILQNLKKRAKKYGYFLRAIDIDRNYNNILSQKVQKLKKQHQRKRKVLQNHRINSVVQKEKYKKKMITLEEKLNQQIANKQSQNLIFKAGIQAVRQEEKNIKKQVKQIQNINNLKLANQSVKRKNKIVQLREQLQKMKQSNKINKTEQKKALTEMQKNNLNDKKVILTIVKSFKQKKLII